ncbi:MAG: iron ABC transporter permease, partial [Sphingopyxis sp.]|nr:iron ABC transporter permease [Sphingopyxis sp.]
MPLIGVVLAALGSGTADIAARDIARYALTSAWLALLVGFLTAVTGTLAAWLVVMHRFPARGFFAWALALPLATPAFALAYGYADLFDVAGPLRSWLRVATGHDLPFELRSTGGAAFILSAAFYPYVYLAMRAAFLNQSVNVLEAARMLGCTGGRALWRVALPMARPALAAGVALAVMETLADYGAVQFLSVQTLTTGV